MNLSTSPLSPAPSQAQPPGSGRRTHAPAGLRSAASALLATLLLACIGCSATADEASRATAANTSSETFAALEQEYDARVGVSLRELDGGKTVSYREHERFGFASTMKVFAVAALLEQTTVRERSQLVEWTSDDLDEAGYSPVTERKTGEGMTLEDLAESAVRQSDNTAMNVALDYLGGPDGLETALRKAGDSVSRPRAKEPGLNEVDNATGANTSTAAALAGNLERLETGAWLEEKDRDLLWDWMTGNATGDSLIRAGAPDTWEVLEKSGGAGPIRNDVALLRGPDGERVVLVILTERNGPDDAYDDALVADVARAVLQASS